jgi:hypothetical protein
MQHRCYALGTYGCTAPFVPILVSKERCLAGNPYLQCMRVCVEGVKRSSRFFRGTHKFVCGSNTFICVQSLSRTVRGFANACRNIFRYARSFTYKPWGRFICSIPAKQWCAYLICLMRQHRAPLLLGFHRNPGDLKVRAKQQAAGPRECARRITMMEISAINRIEVIEQA